MSRSLSWRKALAMSAALALALGGIAVSAAPASAAAADVAISPAEEQTADAPATNTGDASDVPVAIIPSPAPAEELPAPAPSDELVVSALAADFAVLAPTDGQLLDSRTVIFTGTGTDGSTVNVLDSEGNRVPGTTAAVVTDGAWSTTGTYPADADAAQTVAINQVTGGSGDGEQTLSFTLPAAAPAPLPAPVITSPTDGETITDSQVTFAGTGEPGAFIGLIALPTALVEEALPQQRMAAEEPVPADSIPVDEEGNWTITVPLTPEAYTAIAIQSENADGTGEISEPSEPVSFTVLATLSAPVITSPTEGETVTGTQVTFTGTGEPGAFIGLLAVPTALVEEELPEQRMAAAAEPVPANPADPIPVDENGNWTVTLALPPEAYTAVAIQSENAEGTGNISAPSEPVSFTLAAFVPAPAGSGSGTNALAATGGTDGSLLTGIAALALIAGVGAIVVGKRRRVTS